MYDRRSIYALNKKNPDAIVLPDADGNLICLTCADFTDEAEFRRWKRWSDQDFHAEDIMRNFGEFATIILLQVISGNWIILHT